MWTITSTLLFACCLWAALVQSQDHDDIEPGHMRNVWEDVIEFLTKGTRDECSLSVMVQGDLTKLRITCLGMEHSYWCEYQGKPQVCRNYNNNSLHYFRQIMWGLRKLSNACQGQRILKPLMCRKASDEAQMVFISASSSNAEPYRPVPDRPVQMRPQLQKQRPKPTRPQIFRTQPARTAQDKTNQPKAFKSTTQRRIITPKPTVPQPTTQVPLSEAKKLAQDYCWRSFRGVCSFVIGWFRN